MRRVVLHVLEVTAALGAAGAMVVAVLLIDDALRLLAAV